MAPVALAALGLIGALALTPVASAQPEQHGLSISKGCVSPKLVGQTIECTVVLSNTPLTDEALDTHRVTAASDTVTNATGPGATAPMPILSVQNNSGNTSCAAGPSLPCDLASGDSITFLADHYTIVAGDPTPLLDTATVTATDLCDGTPSDNCATSPLAYPANSQTNVASCNVEITKAFDCGDGTFTDGCSALDSADVTSRRVVTNMSSSSGIELRNCSVTDSNTVVGDAGPLAPLGFQESSTPIDVVNSCQNFVDGGEPDTANVACDCFVGGEDTGVDATDQDTSDLTCEACDVQITKLVDCGDGLGPVESCTGITNADGSVGTPVAYSFEVQNLGSIPLTDCSVTDSNVVPEGAPTEFAVGATVPLNDVNAECTTAFEGPNTINVDCACGDLGVRVQAEDTATLDCVSCGASVDKQVDCGGGFVDVTGADDGDGSLTQSCLGWLPFDGNPAEPLDVQFLSSEASETGAAVQNCRLSDTNGLINAEVMGVVNIGDTTDFNGACTEALDEAEGGSNTATLTCDCALEGADLVLADGVVAQDTAGFDCQMPGLSISKTCDDQVGNTNDFDITATNQGDAGLINCQVTDTLYRDDDTCTMDAEDLTDTLAGSVQPFDLPLNGSTADFTGMATDLAATSCNEAAVTCEIDDGTGQPVLDANGAPKTISNSVTADCVVVGGCLTRTIGFWSNRTNFVDEVIGANTGSLTVCGETFTGFSGDNGDGLDSLLCDRGQEILHAQCAAAALNIAASNSTAAGASCSIIEDAVDQFATCCGAPDNGEEQCSGGDINGCIETITAFNESVDSLEPFVLGSVDFGEPGPATGGACTLGGGGPGGGPPGGNEVEESDSEDSGPPRGRGR